jgi:hypothetical protein
MQPLEQTAPELFAAAASVHLSDGRALAAIRAKPGIIPVAVTLGQQVVWLDVGDYAFKEWKFRYSIKNLIDSQGLGACFSTDLELLARDEVLADALMPAGFVFHMSKCGSTLMAKALAQAPSHIVVSEGTPLHENLWRHLTDGWRRPVESSETNLRLLRNLILALGRRRRPEQEHYFVKFRSWTVTFAETIQRAFPHTPCLFMYRDPAEVLVSSLNKPTTGQTRLKESGAASYITGASQETLQGMGDLEYFASLCERHLRAGYEAGDRMAYLNYAQMNPENLPAILQAAFGFAPKAEDLPAMQAQFGRYAKDDTDAAVFVSDVSEKRKQITPAIRKTADERLLPWYRLLETAPSNLNRSLP